MDRKLLIVDDEEWILKLYRKAFEKKGYIVTTAEGGETALNILKEEEIQVMFLDLNMPGMDGLDLCREIRKTDTGARIFAVTGHPTKFEFSECRNAGFDGYFTKPMNLNILLETAQ